MYNSTLEYGSTASILKPFEKKFLKSLEETELEKKREKEKEVWSSLSLNQLKVWPAGRPLCPFDLWFGSTWSTHHKRSCSDTIFGGIPNVLVIS
jgi:hypothetical protein